MYIWEDSQKDYRKGKATDSYVGTYTTEFKWKISWN